MMKKKYSKKYQNVTQRHGVSTHCLENGADRLVLTVGLPPASISEKRCLWRSVNKVWLHRSPRPWGFAEKPISWGFPKIRLISARL